MGLEAFHLVDIVGQRDRTVDGDAVIVVQEDQLRQLQVTRERERLMADALHQVAVGTQHVSMMIDDILAEFRGEQPLGQRRSDRRGDALAKRAGAQWFGRPENRDRREPQQCREMHCPGIVSKQ